MVYSIGRFIGWQIFAAQGLNIVGNTILDGITGLFTSQATDLEELDWALIHVTSPSIPADQPVHSCFGDSRIT